ncbi:MAG: polysaccharide biosynthesis/export family protein [Phycisphaerae bacterium]|nr:polysaccharide biosynthesis/export family protein [Phycisphaerae bacterium]
MIANETQASTSYQDRDRAYPIATSVQTTNQYSNSSYIGSGSNAPSQAKAGSKPIAQTSLSEVDMSEKGYKVGPGDTLAVKIYQLLDINKEENLRSQVDNNGNIYLPLLEDVKVEGQTTEQIKENLVQILSSRYIKDPKVDVSVAIYNSKVAMIIGQVRKPGEVILKSNATTLMDAITMAGGIQGSAAPEIEILRGAYKTVDNQGSPRSNLEKQIIAQTGTQRELVPMSLLFAENGRQENPVIYPGDVIKVKAETEGYVYLMGEVKRPGSTPFRRPLSILQALSCAGGVTSIAEDSECKLIRRLSDGSEKEIIVDLDDIRDGETENILLAQNDTILIPANPTKKFFSNLGRFFRVGASMTYDMAADAGIPSGASAGNTIY